MAPTGPRQHLPHRRARAALRICRLATQRHLIVRARSALRCRVRIRQRYRTGTRPCSRSRGGEVPTWLPSVAFLHTILRARSPNHINIEHLDTFTTDGFVCTHMARRTSYSVLSYYTGFFFRLSSLYYRNVAILLL